MPVGWAFVCFRAMRPAAAVILAAGQGTRMKSRIPKALHTVSGMSMVAIARDTAVAAGYSRVVVVVPDERSPIIGALGGPAPAGSVRSAFAYQPKPLGTGDALLRARDAVAGCDDVLVMNADAPLARSQTLAALSAKHAESGAAVTMLTANAADTRGTDGMGRVVRDGDGRARAVVEERDADGDTAAIREVNAGVYCFRTGWLWDELARIEPSESGEVYLTSLIELAPVGMVETLTVDDPQEAWGVNTRVELAAAEGVMRRRIRERWMLEGVSMPDPNSVYIDYGASIGADTVVLPNTHIRGATRIGADCEIGPNSIIEDSRIGDRCRVVASVIEDATLESGVDVGPFSHMRPGAYLETGVHIGNFGEVKNSRIGRDAKMGHFGYIGDARVGANVNIGAGAITCNYDGERKHGTVIGDDAFIGSDTMLVAPVTVGERSYTSAGAVVNRDVPPDSGAIGAPARIRSKRPSKKSAEPPGSTGVPA